MNFLTLIFCNVAFHKPSHELVISHLVYIIHFLIEPK
jgi:hypothetical protein